MSESKYTLFELNASIKERIRMSFPGACWVVAEVSEVHVNASGHCYIELVEKDTGSEQIVARARAVIWSYVFRLLKPYFETSTGHEFQPGLKVMLSVNVEYHELYGLSLHVKDIDPTYTVGDISRKKLEIIRKLEADGVMNMNKELPLPYVLQRIAVISSETAAGYGDFINHLLENGPGYAFYTKLFPAAMQGKEVENSIISALERVNGHLGLFDAVIIIRGGGSRAELECFNSYWLALHVAQFPIPVISGIGHERDGSIIDLVAHTSVKTPTAVADFIINIAMGFEDKLLGLQSSIVEKAEEALEAKEENMKCFSGTIASLVSLQIEQERENIMALGLQPRYLLPMLISGTKYSLGSYSSRFSKIMSRLLIDQKNRLHLIQKDLTFALGAGFLKMATMLDKWHGQAHLADPVVALKRGYSLTFSDKKQVRTAQGINEKGTITTKLHDGSITSIITKIILNE